LEFDAQEIFTDPPQPGGIDHTVAKMSGGCFVAVRIVGSLLELGIVLEGQMESRLCSFPGGLHKHCLHWEKDRFEYSVENSTIAADVCVDNPGMKRIGTSLDAFLVHFGLKLPGEQNVSDLRARVGQIPAVVVVVVEIVEIDGDVRVEQTHS
jgi:hypothetical protein